MCKGRKKQRQNIIIQLFYCPYFSNFSYCSEKTGYYNYKIDLFLTFLPYSAQVEPLVIGGLDWWIGLDSPFLWQCIGLEENIKVQGRAPQLRSVRCGHLLALLRFRRYISKLKNLSLWNIMQPKEISVQNLVFLGLMIREIYRIVAKVIVFCKRFSFVLLVLDFNFRYKQQPKWSASPKPLHPHLVRML